MQDEEQSICKFLLRVGRVGIGEERVGIGVGFVKSRPSLILFLPISIRS